MTRLHTVISSFGAGPDPDTAKAGNWAPIEGQLACRLTRNRGEESGSAPEEITFQGALADNPSSGEVLGNDGLTVIAHDVLMSLEAKVTVDSAHTEAARARLRVLVKRTPRKHG